MAAVSSVDGHKVSTRHTILDEPEGLSLRCLVAIAIICIIGAVIGKHMAAYAHAHDNPALLWSRIGLALGGFVGSIAICLIISKKIFDHTLRF